MSVFEAAWPVGVFRVFSSKGGKHYYVTAYRCTCKSFASKLHWGGAKEGCKHIQMVRRGEAGDRVTDWQVVRRFLQTGEVE